MLIPTKKLIEAAEAHGYAVGAFNISNLETLLGIAKAAKNRQSPVIIQITQSSAEYAGLKLLADAVKSIANSDRELPIALHLDHGGSVDLVQRAIALGFSSVMFDGSKLAYEENLATTKHVVDLAAPHGITVQAELGALLSADEAAGVGEYTHDEFTDPAAAAKFSAATNIDYLAPSIGNVHGLYKGQPQLDFDRLAEIRKSTKLPLVLHGGSGIPLDDIKRGVSLGIRILNIDTELRISFTNALHRVIIDHPHEVDPRKLLSPSRDAIQRTVESYLDLLGSSGKAGHVITSHVPDYTQNEHEHAPPAQAQLAGPISIPITVK